MRPVIQEDKTGCAFASVATVAGVSYAHVKTTADQLGINVKDPNLWSDTKYIQKLLRSYHIAVSSNVSTFTFWDTLPLLALLAIKWHRIRQGACWHWVVFFREPHGPVVFDPKRELRTHTRTDFGRIKPKWYLTLTTPIEATAN